MRYISSLTIGFSLILLLAFTGGHMKISSTVFTEGGMIPLKYSCEGEGTNPPLHIDHLPAGTKTLALILHDPDAPVKGGFTHWVVWNITPGTEIGEGFTAATQGKNGAGQNKYIGMCPPSGTHHYHFMVYALDTHLQLEESTNKAGLEKAMQGHILAQADLVGLYKKVKQ